MTNLFREYSAYFGQATEAWKRHVIGVTIEAIDEFRDSVCKTFHDVADDSSRPLPDGSVDGQDAVNSQEMFGNVLENAQRLVQQRIADSLAQTFNAPTPILLASLSNQTIQANPPGESAISQSDVNSGQNDDDSVDVSIKSEVDSSSESECESDTDDEGHVKDEPNEEEGNITPDLDENCDDTDEASSHEQTENTDNSGDHRENSNEGASEQQESNDALIVGDESADEGNIEEDPNGPLNAEANEVSKGDEDDLDAEEADDDFGEDEQMDDNEYQHNLENQESDLDGQDESDHEEAIIDEETDGEDFEEQEDMSEVEDNEQEGSGDETNNDDEDYSEDSEDDNNEEEEALLGVAGPSTSAQGRQGTRRVAKRQNVSGNASKRQRTGRDAVTVPLSVITKKLKCTVPGCKKVVKNKESMNRHLLTKHQLKKYRCLVRRCHGKVSTSFATRAQFSDHLDQVHGRTSRLACHCSKKFNSYQELASHYWRYHELGHFTCSKDGCPVKSTTTRVKVQSHQYKHRELKYACPVDNCGKSFKRKDTLDSHILTHTGERPYPCPECDTSFTRKSDCTRHLRIHRNDKCFRCTWPQCTFSSTDGSAVIKHIRMVHFKLPKTKKQQVAADIVDDRDARDYLAKN